MSLRQVQPLEVKQVLGFSTAQSTGGYDVYISGLSSATTISVENAGEDLTTFDISDLIPIINLHGGIGQLQIGFQIGTIQPEASTGVIQYYLNWGQDPTAPITAFEQIATVDYANVQNIMNLTGTYNAQANILMKVPPDLDPAVGLYIAIRWENINAPDNTNLTVVAYTPVVALQPPSPPPSPTPI